MAQIGSGILDYGQQYSLTGKKKKPQYADIIRTQAAYLPQLYAAKEQREFKEKELGLAERELTQTGELERERLAQLEGLSKQEMDLERQLAEERMALDKKLAEYETKSREGIAQKGMAQEKKQAKIANIIGGAQVAATVISGVSSCCFIFIASHGYLHPIVRQYRDIKMNARNRRGYYWLADRLVPMMAKSKFMSKLVEYLMVKPMTCYGKYYFGLNRIGAMFAGLTKFWLIAYTVLGMRPPYRRKGTNEVV